MLSSSPELPCATKIPDAVPINSGTLRVQGTVAVRARGAAGNKQDIMPLADFIAKVVKEKETRAVAS